MKDFNMTDNKATGELRKLQLTQLSILKEVDRICRKYDIKYYLTAGTLLGAVRHKGFIPWDDDLDIGMSYTNYKRFCEICKTELDNNKYFLQNLENDPHHLYIFAKLRLQNTLCVRKGQEHLGFHHGIYIDIFPTYPMPESNFLFHIYAFIIARCKTIMWSPVGAVSERNPLLKFIYKILSKIPKKIPQRIIYNIISKCNSKNEASLGTPSFGKINLHKQRKKEANIQGSLSTIFNNLQVSKVMEMEFEGYKLYTPINYDFILKYYYNDYMKFPPQNEQYGHHNLVELKFE